MKHSLLILLCLLTVFTTQAQLLQPNAKRFMRQGDYVKVTNAAGGEPEIYASSLVKVLVFRSTLVRVIIDGASDYYGPSQFLDGTGTPYGSTAQTAVDAWALTSPALLTGTQVSSAIKAATAPLATSLTAKADIAALNALSNVVAPTVTVEAYGARADDQTDDTPAFVAAVATGKSIDLLEGTYLIRPRFNGIATLSNMTLRGKGAGKTVIRFDTSYVKPANGNYYVGFYLGSNVSIYELTIDGARAGETKTGYTNGVMSSNLLKCIPTTPQKNILLNHVRLTGAPAVGNLESFGILTHGSTNVQYISCEADNNNGTGLHFDGNYYTVRGGQNIARDVYCHDNTWMGISLYGTRDAIVSGIFDNNLQHGVNLEWTDNVVLSGTAKNNGIAGIGTWGYNAGTKINNWIGLNNGSSTTTQTGEVIFRTSSFGTTVNPATATLEYSIMQSIEFNNVSLTPATGKAHIWIARDISVLNLGNAQPQLIQANSDGAENWTISVSDGNGAPATSFTTGGGFKFSRLQKFGKIQLGSMFDWSRTLNMGIVSYAGTGQKSASPKTLTSNGNAQFNNIRAAVPNIGTFLCRVRFKLENAGNWKIFTAGSSTNRNIFSIPNSVKDIGVWQEAEFLVRVDPSQTYSLQIQNDDVGTGQSLSIDYIEFYSLSATSYEGTNEFRDRQTTFGTAAPTFGTYRVGDYRWNTAPSEQGTTGTKYIIRGWSCVAAGSPGTWIQDRGLTGN